MTRPEKLSFWQHKNGNIYVVIGLANEHSRNLEKYPVTVIYENPHSGTIWTKPLDNFLEKMTPCAN